MPTIIGRLERRRRWEQIRAARLAANTYKRNELRAAFDEGFAEGLKQSAGSPPRLMSSAEKVAWGKGYSAGVDTR